jgi:hypothetical protein
MFPAICNWKLLIVNSSASALPGKASQATLFQGWLYSPHDIGRVFHGMAQIFVGEGVFLLVGFLVWLLAKETALPHATAG